MNHAQTIKTTHCYVGTVHMLQYDIISHWNWCDARVAFGKINVVIANSHNVSPCMCRDYTHTHRGYPSFSLAHTIDAGTNDQEIPFDLDNILVTSSYWLSHNYVCSYCCPPRDDDVDGRGVNKRTDCGSESRLNNKKEEANKSHKRRNEYRRSNIIIIYNISWDARVVASLWKRPANKIYFMLHIVSKRP